MGNSIRTEPLNVHTNVTECGKQQKNRDAYQMAMARAILEGSVSATQDCAVKFSGLNASALVLAEVEVRSMVQNFLISRSQQEIMRWEETFMKNSALGLTRPISLSAVEEQLVKDILRKNSPLGLAAILGQTEIVTYLVGVPEIKNALDLKNLDGKTPLYAACYANQRDCVAILIRAGSNIHAKIHGGWHPLVCAVWLGYVDIVEILLTCPDLDIDFPVDDGETALIVAAEFGFPLIASKLLSGKADVNRQQLDGQTALHMAVSKRNNEVLKVLLENCANTEMKDNGGFTALCRAGEVGNVEAFTLLQQFQADLSAHGWNENTCFHLAAARGHTVFFDALEREKDDVIRGLIHTHNAMGLTVSQLALTQGHSALSEFIDNHFDSPKLTKHKKLHALAFEQSAKSLKPTISLDFVELIPKKKFFEGGEFLHHDIAKAKKWLVTAREVMHLPETKILFLSHRWGSTDHPDPTTEQFALVKDFLLEAEVSRSITHLWVDYTCINQNKSSVYFKQHLDNIPTAVACAEIVLVVPKVEHVPHTVESRTIPLTSLNDYLGRAWCTLEWMAALLSGCNVYITFQLGSHTFFQHFPPPEAAGASLGFNQAYLDSFNPLLENKAVYDITLGVCYKHWQCTESCALLTGLHQLSQELGRGEKPKLGQKISNMCVTKKDVSLDENLSVMMQLLGNTFDPKDKILVFNILLFIGLFYFKGLQGVDLQKSLRKFEGLEGCFRFPFKCFC